MDNIKFAIKFLVENSHKMIEEGNNYAVQSVNIAIEALERGIAQKPVVDVTHGILGTTIHCPECGVIVEDGHGGLYRFCPKCGQRLDWEG